MTAPSTSEREVVKWYTNARKFPQLIGRTPDGARIWGGPYTFTQAVGAGLVLLVGVNTMGLWARYGLIGNALVLLTVTYGTVLALGRLPVGARSPLSVAAGTLRALGAPRTGRLAGRPVRLRRPHRLRHHTTVLLAAHHPPAPRRPTAAPVPAPALTGPLTPARQHSAPAPRPAAARRELTSVQALLAQPSHRPRPEDT